MIDHIATLTVWLYSILRFFGTRNQFQWSILALELRIKMPKVKNFDYQ